jgi:hypothetical protein
MPEQFGSGQIVARIVPLRTEIIVVDAEGRSGDSGIYYLLQSHTIEPWPPPRLLLVTVRRSVNSIPPSSDQKPNKERSLQ